MVIEALLGLPEWLSLGLLLGFGMSLCAAVLFYVGDRLFPSAKPAESSASDARRVTEIRRYLDAIGEQYAEDHPVAGQTVEFYLPLRDVAITFDARAFYIIERTDTHAVLVEHELPGVHLGSRLPFETPEIDFGSPVGATVDPVEGAYEVLGVPRTATEDQVREAYRRRVKEVHPDHGGDRDEFRRVREAYTTVTGAEA